MEPARRARATSRLICILALFITRGNSLKCLECKDLSGDSCVGESVICQSGSNVCISSLVHYQKVPTWVFMRFCGNSEQCPEVVTLRTPYSRMVTSNKCCMGDNCTPSRPPVIAEEAKNGLICKGCFNATSDTCQEHKSVECRGTERQCFTYYNRYLEGNRSIAMEGCATKTACALDLNNDGKETMCYGESYANRSPQIASSLSFAAFFIVLYLC
ncbi:PREDICTED: phospholipase A2 inhibitor subunit gamma B-like [Nanorana parkeri]|uniref:phospholipase A2 inhibitor subunit gamma B-like n=1 Tax=Nanorana parkeri TaxID=125878 RepID=UPI000854AB32|nr:PREDICTED: phospholipase A2 inhibitor subunit gamma B-like [Nanorana parkeri]